MLSTLGVTVIDHANFVVEYNLKHSASLIINLFVNIFREVTGGVRIPIVLGLQVLRHLQVRLP